MNTLLHVLFIGSENAQSTIYSRSPERGYDFIPVKAYRDLLAVAATESIRVAVLSPALSLEELVRSAQIVRWRWPQARILMVRAEKPLVDDALYDDRLDPHLSPELLLKAIDRVIHTPWRANERQRLWEC